MASASDYLETAMLDHITGNEPYPQPGILYIALFSDLASAAELEQGILTNEISGVNYSRKSAVFDPAVQGQSQNGNTVVFNQAGAGGWGDIQYVAVMDAFTNGNILLHGSIGPLITINDGDSFKFNINNLVITIT